MDLKISQLGTIDDDYNETGEIADNTRACIESITKVGDVMLKRIKNYALESKEKDDKIRKLEEENIKLKEEIISLKDEVNSFCAGKYKYDNEK